MKAGMIDKYGGNDVVEIRDSPKPICGPEEVLIKVRAAGVNPVDWKVRYGRVRIVTGYQFPKILGNECAGEVAEVGSRVKNLKEGDAVIGWPGVRKLGAFAEYACSGETTTCRKSKGVSFEDAACLPIAGMTALLALRDKGRIAEGRKALINGASGGVGHFAVQIARLFGAEVTGVCSGANVEFVRGIGADSAIDYTKEDFTRGGARYDIIFDAVAKRSFGECKRVLAPKGIYISTLPSPSAILSQYLTGFFTGKKARIIMVSQNETDLQWMQNQIQSGKLKVVIDKIFPLIQAKEALAYSETGKARGKIVLKTA